MLWGNEYRLRGTARKVSFTKEKGGMCSQNPPLRENGGCGQHSPYPDRQSITAVTLKYDSVHSRALFTRRERVYHLRQLQRVSSGWSVCVRQPLPSVVFGTSDYSRQHAKLESPLSPRRGGLSFTYHHKKAAGNRKIVCLKVKDNYTLVVIDRE